MQPHRPSLILPLLLFSVVSSAGAHSIGWQLSGVTLTDGGTVSGSFTYNPHTGDVTAWNISVAGGADMAVLPPFTYTPATSTLIDSPPPGAAGRLGFATSERELFLAPTLPLPDGGSAVIPLATGTLDSSECTVGLITVCRLVTAGSVAHLELEAPVPTVSEWGLIVIGLLLLIGATIVLGFRRPALVGMSGAPFALAPPLPLFSAPLFARCLGAAAALLTVTLALVVWLEGSVNATDLIGSSITTVGVAYLVHLWLLLREGGPQT